VRVSVGGGDAVMGIGVVAGGGLVSCGARVIGTRRILYRGLGRGGSVSNSDGLHDSPYWEGIDRAHLLASVFLRRPVLRLIRETR
jgi:hypothetical protein